MPDPKEKKVIDQSGKSDLQEGKTKRKSDVSAYDSGTSGPTAEDVFRAHAILETNIPSRRAVAPGFSPTYGDVKGDVTGAYDPLTDDLTQRRQANQSLVIAAASALAQFDAQATAAFYETLATVSLKLARAATDALTDDNVSKWNYPELESIYTDPRYKWAIAKPTDFLRERSAKAMPIYFHGEMDMADPKWWLANVVPQLGTSAGAITASALTSAGIAGLLGKTALGASLGKTGTKLLAQTISAPMARVGESTMEAREVYDDVYHKSRQMFGEKEARILASNAASKAYKQQLPLMILDFIQLNALNKALSVKSSIKSGVKTIFTESITEGPEEFFQFESNLAAKYNSVLVDSRKFPGNNEALLKSMKEYNEDDLFVAVLSGALGGALMGGIGAAVNVGQAVKTDRAIKQYKDSFFNQRASQLSGYLGLFNEGENVGSEYLQQQAVTGIVSTLGSYTMAEKGSVEELIQAVKASTDLKMQKSEELGIPDIDLSNIQNQKDKIVTGLQEIQNNYEKYLKKYPTAGKARLAEISRISYLLNNTQQEIANTESNISNIEASIPNRNELSISGYKIRQNNKVINSYKAMLRNAEDSIKKLPKSLREKSEKNLKKFEDHIEELEKENKELEEIYTKEDKEKDDSILTESPQQDKYEDLLVKKAFLEATETELLDAYKGLKEGITQDVEEGGDPAEKEDIKEEVKEKSTTETPIGKDIKTLTEKDELPSDLEVDDIEDLKSFKRSVGNLNSKTLEKYAPIMLERSQRAAQAWKQELASGQLNPEQQRIVISKIRAQYLKAAFLENQLEEKAVEEGRDDFVARQSAVEAFKEIKKQKEELNKTIRESLREIESDISAVTKLYGDFQRSYFRPSEVFDEISDVIGAVYGDRLGVVFIQGNNVVFQDQNSGKSVQVLFPKDTALTMKDMGVLLLKPELNQIETLSSGNGFIINGFQFYFNIEAPLESITYNNEGYPSSVTLIDSEGNTVNLTNPLLVSEIASNIEILESATDEVIKNWFLEDNDFMVVADPYSKFDKEYYIYRKEGKYVVVNPDTNRSVPYDSPLATRVLESFHTQITVAKDAIINQIVDELNINLKEQKDEVRRTTETARPATAEETLEAPPDGKVKVPKGTKKKTGKQVKESDIIDGPITEQAADNVIEENTKPEEQPEIDNQFEPLSTTETVGVEKEQKALQNERNKAKRDVDKILDYAAIKSGLKTIDKDMDDHLSDPSTDLSKSRVDFKINFTWRKFWDKHPEFEKKVKEGTATEKDLTKEIIEELPIGLEYKHPKFSKTDNLFLYTVKYPTHKAAKERLFKSRKNIITNLINGKVVYTTNLSRDRGRFNNIDPNVSDRKKNVSVVFNKAADLMTLGRGHENGIITTGTGKMSGIGHPGAVYLETTSTANGAAIPVRLNPSKISEEHARLILGAFQARYRTGGYQNKFEPNNKTSGLTAGEFLDLMVVHGKGTKQKGLNNPQSHLIPKQLYVESTEVNGKKRMILYYGEEGKMDLFSASTQEKQDFVRWVKENKNYAAIEYNDRLKTGFNGKFNKPFSIAGINIKKGDSYNKFLLDNNFYTTDLNPERPFVSPHLYMEMNENKLSIEDPVEESPEKFVKKPKPIQDNQTSEATALEEGAGEVLPDGSFIPDSLIQAEYERQKDREKKIQEEKGDLRPLGDDLFDDYNDTPPLEAKPAPYAFTIQNIQEDLNWLNNKLGLGDGFVEFTGRLIPIAGNRHAFGVFRGDSMLIYESAPEGTIMHEAFHRVFRAYLTEEERQRFFDLASKEYGIKRDDINSLEEHMAERFREYVLADRNNTKLKEKKPLLKNLYENLLDFIKNILNLSNKDINRLFEGINKGKYRGAKVLKANEALIEKSYSPLEVKGKKIDSVTSSQQLNDIIRGLTAIGILKNKVTSIETIKEFDMNSIYEQVSNYKNRLEGSEQATDYHKDLYTEIVDNFWEVFAPLLEDELRNLNIKTKIDEESLGSYEKYTQASYETSTKDNTMAEIKILISTLRESNEADPSTMMFKLVDGNAMWGELLSSLYNMDSYYDMIEHIKKKAETVYSYKELYNRLEKGTEILKTQFEVSMKKAKHQFFNLLFENNKGKYSYSMTSADTQTTAIKLRKQWSQALARSDMFVGKDRGINKNKANKLISQYEELWKSVQKEMNSKGSISDQDIIKTKLEGILNELSIPVYKNVISNVIDSYDSENSSERMYDFMGDLYNIFGRYGFLKIMLNGDSVRSKDKIVPNAELLLNESITYKLAEAYAELQPNLTEDTILGPDGNLYYKYAQKSFITEVERKIAKDAEYVNQLLQTTYNKNSFLLSQLKDDKTRKGFNLRTLAGFVQQNSGDTGREYFSITDLEDYLFKLHSMLNNNIPLPTLADRKTYYLYNGLKRIEFKYEVDNGNLIIPNSVIDVFEGYYNDEQAAIKQALDKRKAVLDAYEEKNDKKADPTKFVGEPDLIENYHYKYNKDGTKDLTKGNAYSSRYFKSVKKDSVRESIINILEERIQEEFEFAHEIGVVNGKVDNKGNLRPSSNRLIDDSVVSKETSYFGSEKFAVRNILADYTINYMMSTIETEKIMFGDPAFYKNIDDKTKRLPALASTGDILRVIFPESHELYNKEQYRTITLESHVFRSKYLDTLVDQFTDLIQRSNSSRGIEITKQKAKKEAERVLKGYTNVDQTDAQVYITPYMYRSISIRLGEWNDNKQKAFEALNSDRELTVEEEIEYSKLVMQPLKTVYFGNIFDNGLQIPLYDKMSMATLFRRTVKGTDLEPLLDHMENNDIQAAKFDTAVKVGLRDKQKYYDDNYNINPITVKPFSQNFSDLLRQQVTDTHDVFDTLLGTQFKKVAMSNVDPSADYQLEGKSVKGSDILNNIHSALSELSERGKQKLSRRLGFDLDTLRFKDDSKLKKEMQDRAKEAGLADNTVDWLIPGINFDTHPDRKYPQASVISMVTKETVDVRMPGNAFIQMTNFGLNEFGRRFDDSLKFIRLENGTVKSMECMVSVSLFKHVIPNYEKKTHKQREAFLKNNPHIVGYRIPTQGLNSVSTMVVKKFLPETLGDTIVLPAEFTALTGSDFDIDKLYVARYNYETVGGKTEKIKFIEEDTNSEEGLKSYYNAKYSGTIDRFNRLTSLITEEEDRIEDLTKGEDLAIKNLIDAMIQHLPGELQEGFTQEEIDELLEEYGYSAGTYNKLRDAVDSIPSLEEFVKENRGKTPMQLNSKEAVENRLLDSYSSVLLSQNHFVQSVTPLDAVTESLKDIANRVRKWRGETLEFKSDLSETTPKYHNTVKSKNIGGQSGIGPFALNNVHHVLGQQVGLSLYYNIGFGNTTTEGYTDLSQVYGKDNIPILDWISALINAHVDNAKDPYISSMNVSKETWSLVNLLIRSGIGGEKTMLLLSQPSVGLLSRFKAQKKGLIKNSEKNPLSQARGILLSEKMDFLSKKGIKGHSYKRETKPLEELTYLYDEGVLEKAIKDYYNSPSPQAFDTQLDILDLIGHLEQPANKLNEAVLSSQIDTKKQGNNLIEIRNFNNKLKKVLHDSDTYVGIKNIHEIFKSTFLNSVYTNGIGLINELFAGSTISSTTSFGSMVDIILTSLKLKYLADTSVINKVSNELFSTIAAEFFVDLKGWNADAFKGLIFGNDSLANRLYKIKTSGKYNLKILDVIEPNIPDNNKDPHIILSYAPDAKDKFVKDDITRSWLEALQSEDANLRSVAEDLVVYSFFSSGFNKNFYSFFSYIPIGHLQDIGYNDFITQKLEELNTEDYSLIDKFKTVFENNHNNVDLVPRVNSVENSVDMKGSDNPGLIEVSDPSLHVGLNENGDAIGRPFVSYTGELYKYIGHSKGKMLYALWSKKGYNNKGVRLMEFWDTVFEENKNLTPSLAGIQRLYPEFSYVPTEDQFVNDYLSEYVPIENKTETNEVVKDAINIQKETIEETSEENSEETKKVQRELFSKEKLDLSEEAFNAFKENYPGILISYDEWQEIERKKRKC